MNAEDKLDVALRFLADNSKGSFDYLDKFNEHLSSVGIQEKDILPLILHLKKNHYVELFYKDAGDEKHGRFPHQMKITFRGIKFIEKGGYASLESKSNLQKFMTWVPILLSIGALVLSGINTSTNINDKNKRDKMQDEIELMKKQIDSLENTSIPNF